MAQTTPGTAVPETTIDWLAGSQPDLSEREIQLKEIAREEGYQVGFQAGEKFGYRKGGEAAIHAMTTLVTHVSAKDFVAALVTLHDFFVHGDLES